VKDFENVAKTLAFHGVVADETPHGSPSPQKLPFVFPD
jgi:hypothetical protein